MGRGLYAILMDVAIFDTKDDVGSFGGGDDVRERGIGTKFDCLSGRGDDICCV